MVKKDLIKVSNKIEFFPKEKLIIADTDDMYTIYSHWKRWVLTGLNAMHTPAFRTEMENEKQVIILNEDWTLKNNI